MSLERLKSVPTFPHKIDEYELARMDPTDAYIARKNSELQQAIDWNNDQTLLINNAVVDQNDEVGKIRADMVALNKRLDQWDQRYAILVAKIKSPFWIASGIFALIAPAIIQHIVEHYWK